MDFLESACDCTKNGFNNSLNFLLKLEIDLKIKKMNEMASQYLYLYLALVYIHSLCSVAQSQSAIFHPIEHSPSYDTGKVKWCII